MCTAPSDSMYQFQPKNEREKLEHASSGGGQFPRLTGTLPGTW